MMAFAVWGEVPMSALADLNINRFESWSISRKSDQIAISDGFSVGESVLFLHCRQQMTAVIRFWASKSF